MQLNLVIVTVMAVIPGLLLNECHLSHVSASLILKAANPCLCVTAARAAAIQKVRTILSGRLRCGLQTV